METPLSTCSACGGQVSTAAAACPHCGHPLQRQATTSITGPAGCGLQVLGAFLVLAGIGAMGSPDVVPGLGVGLLAGGVVMFYLGGRPARVKRRRDL